MPHARSQPSFTLAVHRASRSSDDRDVHLLALGPAFQEAARARRAYNRDLDQSVPNSEWNEVEAESLALSGALADVLKRIFTHKPYTLEGLALIAQAAAVGAAEPWDAAQSELDTNGKLLRHVVNGLFGLLGTNWRGQFRRSHLAEVAPHVLRTEPQPDSAIAKMLTKATTSSPDLLGAVIEAHRAAREAFLASTNSADIEYVRQASGDTSDVAMAPARRARDAAEAAEGEAWDAVLSSRPTDPAGLARMLRYVAESPASEIVDDPQDLLTQLAQAAEAVAGTSGPGASAKGEAEPTLDAGGPRRPATDEPDPVLALVGASRRANDRFAAACRDPKYGTPAGDAVAQRSGQANADAWKALLAARARTSAGARAVAVHAVSWIQQNGGIDSDETVQLLNVITQATDSQPRNAKAVELGSVFAAIERHQWAYAGRLRSESGRLRDAAKRADKERAAFRDLLLTPLRTDAERVAYAIAVIDRACGQCASDCQGGGRGGVLPTAYRNLAHGQYQPEEDAPLLIAAE